MELIAYIFLGILQGIAEWLPISSQGQIMLAGMSIFGLSPSFAIELTVWLHLGTVLSALVYFRNQVFDLLKRFPVFILLITSKKKIEREQDKLTFFLIVSTVFSGIVGIPLYVVLKKSFASLSGESIVALVGFFLIITGFLLYKAGSKKFGNKKTIELNLKDAVFAGVFQGFSILPGISRSGTSTAALLLRGFNQEDALKLSFLMSIVVVSSAEIVFGFIEGFSFSIGSVVALVFAFVTGFLSIEIFLRIAKKVSFWLFCIILGIISLVPFVFSFWF